VPIFFGRLSSDFSGEKQEMSSFRNLAMIACVAVLAGCAGSMPTMQTVDSQQQSAVPSNKSRVVFMRSSFYGSVINASLYDVTKGEPIFIGILPNASRIAYDVDPGEHTFMVQSEAADFMRAHVSAGKTYYAIVTPRMGAWTARFSLAPVRSDDTSPSGSEPARIKEMKTNTKLLTNTNETREWFKTNLGDIKTKQAEFRSSWQVKPETTLNANDGR
jgi:hypothetical protein